MADVTIAQPTQRAYGEALRRLHRMWLILRRWPILSALFLGIVVIGTVFAPWVAPYGEQEGSLVDSLEPPVFFGGSSDHILGTDTVGRDVLSRTLYGGRVSLMVAGVVLLVSGTVGTFLGLLSGYNGGWVDEVIMRIVDLKNSVPLILVALVVAATFGNSLTLLLVLLAFWQWGGFARQVRGEVLTLKEMDYVKLAQVAGASNFRIMVWHIFPGVSSTVLVIATHMVGGVILLEASLSFLGAGIPPPTPAWGSMVAEGRLYISLAWWVSIIPGVAIGLTVMAFTFLGDWLRDRMDPRLRQLN